MGIYIVGAHRSGTSVLARFVGRLVDYDGIRGAADDNAEGHWEDPRVNRALEACFRNRGHDWASPPMEPLRWDARDADQRAQLVQVIREMSARPWVLKDPRFCIALIAMLELEPGATVIATFRNPHEVARSLMSRDKYEYEYGLALWEVYTRAMVQQIQSSDVGAAWTSYDQLMSAPEDSATAFATYLRERGYSIDSGAEDRAIAALNSALRHHEQPTPRTALSTSQSSLLEMVSEAVSTGSLPKSPLPPLTGWAAALLETRRPYQQLERDNRLLVRRLGRLRWAYESVDWVRRAVGLAVPEDPFMRYR